MSLEGSPSSFSESKLCAKVQTRSGGPAFACFRPFVGPPLALPASLVSPVFAGFLRDCEASLASLGRCDLESNCASTLLQVMPAFYSEESERQVLVNAALSTLLGRRLSLIQPDAAESSSRSDGGLVASAEGLDALLLLTEHKNEMGSSDPYFQLQRAYGMYWEASGRWHSHPHRCDACPALALEVVGPLLRVNALASLHANRVLCEPLTPFLPFLQLRDQPEAMARLLVTLRALRNAVKGLDAHYTALSRSRSGSGLGAAGGGGRSPDIALPYPLREGGRFSAARQLCDDRLVYVAKDESRGGELVCVKFSRARGDGRAVQAAWAALEARENRED